MHDLPSAIQVALITIPTKHFSYTICNPMSPNLVLTSHCNINKSIFRVVRDIPWWVKDLFQRHWYDQTLSPREQRDFSTFSHSNAKILIWSHKQWGSSEPELSPSCHPCNLHPWCHFQQVFAPSLLRSQSPWTTHRFPSSANAMSQGYATDLIEQFKTIQYSSTLSTFLWELIPYDSPFAYIIDNFLPLVVHAWL